MTASDRSRFNYVVLGIDPGSKVAGFGCIGSYKAHPQSVKDLKIIDAGVIKLSASSSGIAKIRQIHEAVYDIIESLQPTTCVIEKAFLGANVQSALKLGEIRGSIIAACQRFRIPVVEFAPTRVKKMVAGFGHATKEDISRSLATLINYQEGLLPHDASDALALALCHAMEAPVIQALGGHGALLQQNIPR